jgi:dihydropteroate synthase
MPRKPLEWMLRGQSLQLGERTIIGVILDLSPDSGAGGRYQDPDRAFVRAMELADQGADFLELVPAPLMSGRPLVPDAEVIRRVVPLLKRIRDRVGIPVAVQTHSPAVAEKALEHGAEILHDPSALTFESTLAKVASQHDAGLLLSHLRGLPESWNKIAPMKDPLTTVAQELSAAVSRATRVGVIRKRIAIDPGLGQGKRKEQDFEILANVAKFGVMELPLSLSVTGKTFLQQTDPSATLAAEAAAACAALLAGTYVLRVHDLASIRSAVAIADTLLRV